MPIETLSDGSMIITGDSIDVYRLLALKHALKLETLGMKRRGRSVFSVIKQEFGLKGSKIQVLEKYTELLKTHGIG